MEPSGLPPAPHLDHGILCVSSVILPLSVRNTPGCPLASEEIVQHIGYEPLHEDCASFETEKETSCSTLKVLVLWRWTFRNLVAPYLFSVINSF